MPIERTVIGGFSQGAVMSYALGLGARSARRPPGIIALSGFIPTVAGFSLDLESRRGLPVAIGHGTLDPVIGVEFGRDARDRLTRRRLDVTLPRDADVAHHRPRVHPRAARLARGTHSRRSVVTPRAQLDARDGERLIVYGEDPANIAGVLAERGFAELRADHDRARILQRARARGAGPRRGLRRAGAGHRRCGRRCASGSPATRSSRSAAVA